MLARKLPGRGGTGKLKTTVAREKISKILSVIGDNSAESYEAKGLDFT